MRGFFGGLLVGLVVATLGTGVLSLLVPKPQRPDVGVLAPRAVPDTPADATERPSDPSGADADLVDALPTAPDATGDAPDGLSNLDDADTAPADKPQVGEATSDMGTPQAQPGAPAVETEAQDPEIAQSQADAPMPPSEDAPQTGSISTDPSQPPMPELAAPETGFQARPPIAGETPQLQAGQDETVAEGDSAAIDQPGTEAGPDVSTDPGAAPQPETGGGTAETPSVPNTPPVVAGDDSAPSATAPTRPDAVADAGDAPEDAPEADTASPEAAPRPTVRSDLPQAGTEEDSASLSPGVGTPVVPLTERQVGVAPDAAPAAAEVVPPIEAYAAAFERTDERPLMSILLIDDSESVGAEALQDFPYPISFAIDPSEPGAADKMAAHRAAGFEVVLLANLAPAASAQDAETSFGVWLDTLPETVALLEGTGTGFQGNRELSDQITDIARSTGRGLILQSSGLNTAQKLALRAGVPSATVFRDFDGAGQTPTVMRRFLDQAAFRARQEGGVIMLGRVRPDTVSALLLWGLQDRAQRVALSPVTAVLKAALPEETQ